MKPYPAYKDSGIEWIGEIPEHWVIRRIGSNASLLTGFAFESENFSYNDEHIKLLRGDNVTTGELRWGDKKRHWPEFSKDLERFLLESNDIVIGMDGSKVGKNYAMVKEEDLPLILVQRVARIRCMQSLIPRFAYYFIANAMFSYYVDTTMTNTAVPHITLKNIRDYPICFPPLPEQQSIAEFLYNKTTQIDTLIEKKQKQIELLKEERTAIINQAVTKGLNPDVPMKDSGIEWLGEVPEHWNVTVAKRFSDIFIPQRNKPELNDVEGIPWVTLECIGDTFVRQTQFFVRTQDAKIAGSRILPTGSVIASCVGRFGIASITTEPVIINQQIQAYIIKHDILPMFLRHYIEASKIYFEMEGNSTTLAYVDREAFGSLPIAVPPILEQKVIIEVVNVQIAKASQLIEKIQKQITLLQEYRTALISNAVTGKIDVRDTPTAILE